MTAADAASPGQRNITLFLSGDVMPGRGIDQVLPCPGRPEIHEPCARSALEYVALAEHASGPIAKPVAHAYIWGDALAELERRSADVRIINLETAVTRSEDAWPGKGIHYRMHPENIPCIATAGIDCCVLANNHVLDWGYPGLEETLATLHRSGLKTAGAGRNDDEAAAPAVLEVPGKGRVLVFAFGHESSGVPPQWAATEKRSGINLLPDLSEATASRIGQAVRAVKRPGDIALVSLHWGSNWGYDIPREHRAFAHQLVDSAAIDILHGHSSHHPRGIEVYRNKPILYGCGDLLNDYEGITGYEQFRGDLALLYFVTFDAANGRLVGLGMTPLQIRRLRLNRASSRDAAWLKGMLDRECARWGGAVEMSAPKPAAPRQAPRGGKKHLGRPGVFLGSAPKPAAPRQAPRGGKKHLGRPGVFLESPEQTLELRWAG
ncbi:MAG: CapA family protein [Betaproteobacteria bacterium]|nr:CapA family protein [Betaproteobacteria bacterium]